MASDLLLSVNDLKASGGNFLGYGRGDKYGESTWTTRQTNNLNDALKKCLSQVYTPPPVSPGEAPHRWSFLRPISTVVLTAGTDTIPLPGDYGGLDTGEVYLGSPAAAWGRTPLKVTHEGMVQQAHARQPNSTGPPCLLAERVLPGTSRNDSSRYVLYVWPVSDQDYTVAVQYKHLPSALTGDYPYPPGGAEHSELFRASMLAVCELDLDNEPGPMRAYFMERLAASVAVDNRRKGAFLGYSGDAGLFDRFRFSGPDRLSFMAPATYNGEVL